MRNHKWVINMMKLAKILLFPLVVIGLILKAYDKAYEYIQYKFRIRKKWKSTDKAEDWWI
ncbi:hypothetical protein HMPREF9466_02047 [Fusobacterium necrophorum subsp. funduliforme 1_1_36S]|nr:hypothetical protein HMPREF9466_02047 [Fusobacterium necrophorum subsp. funduliforme 1_1_36S]